MGYFGHINCSENFNNALKKYEVKSRKGWTAINLFFNTSINQLNVASFDEPWSRPGDYVLFRASKDLICASSACPCDVDPQMDGIQRIYLLELILKNKNIQKL